LLKNPSLILKRITKKSSPHPPPTSSDLKIISKTEDKSEPNNNEEGDSSADSTHETSTTPVPHKTEILSQFFKEHILQEPQWRMCQNFSYYYKKEGNIWSARDYSSVEYILF
jgi:hypothetical protein